jgi:hypothetical protein
MFRYFSLEATKRFFIGLYCRGKFEECERRKLREKGIKVPDTLLPDGQRMADDHGTSAT